MNQCKLSTAVASVLLASASVLGHGIAMASQVDVAPLPSGVIDFVVNQPVGPKAVMAEQFIQAVNQMRDVLSRHVGPAPRLSTAQTVTYLAAARSDIAAQNGSLSSIRSEVLRAFKSASGARAALRELALLESALSRAARADSVDELRTSAKAAMALLTRYEQANERDQAAAPPAHPTLSLPTPYQMAPLPVARTLPSYARGGTSGVSDVLTASLGNAVLLPTPTEAATCGYTSADLDKTREEVNSIKYPEIAALAKSLGYSPVKIFSYVYENIDYQYDYFGSLKGGYGAYLTKRGNAFDQASLLIALLRASNIPARYVFGNAEITDAVPSGAAGRVNRWLGTTSYAVSRTVHQKASGSAPTLIYDANQQPVGLRMFHVWVQACVPYANYRGSSLSNRGHRWIPLDASFKDKSYQPGIPNTVGFDLEAFLARRTNGADSLPHEKFLKDVEASVRSAHPGKGLKDVPYKGKITPIPFDVLPATLPYRVQAFFDVGGGISDPAAMPEGFRQALKVVVSSPSSQTIVERSIPLVEGLFKRMTLSFKGANATHQARIDSWRNNTSMDSPEPSCASSDPTLVVPSIKLDGAEVASGAADKGLGFCVSNARLAMHVSVPVITCTKNGASTSEGCVNSTQFTNIEGSTIYALLAYGDHASTEYLQKRVARLQASIRSSLTAPNSNPDEIEGEFLNIVAQKYGNYVNDSVRRIADGSGRSIPSLGIHLGVTKAKSKISYVFDQPFALNRKGFVIDIPGGRVSFFDSRDGGLQNDLFFLAGRTGSALAGCGNTQRAQLRC